MLKTTLIAAVSVATLAMAVPASAQNVKTKAIVLTIESRVRCAQLTARPFTSNQ